MLVFVQPWWILGVAAVLSAWWVVRVFGATLNSEIFVNMIKKLVNSKNTSRAIKLMSAAPDIPVAVATKAAILASVSREDETNRPAGYRGSRPVHMDTVRVRIRARYDEAFSTCAAPLQKSFFLALPAPFLLGGAAYLALVPSETDWTSVGIAGAALLVWLYTGRSHLQILSSRNACFEAMWPSFEAIYHDRHAIDLDDKPIYPLPDMPAPAPEMQNAKITFEILEPGKPLRTVPIDQPIIKIGTFATSHVQLSAEGVARMHAVIEIADGKATIIDLGAERQTRVNLEPVNKRELASGDVIGIGEAELVVRLGGPS